LQEVNQVEGLVQIVRDAQAKGPHRVGLAGITRDDKAGGAPQVFLHTGQGFQAVQALHPDIQDHQVQGLALGGRHGLLSAGHRQDPVALVLQDLR